MAITLSAPAQPMGPAINITGYGAAVEQGTQVYLVVQGQIIGYVSHLSRNDSYSPQPFMALGLILPADIQPMAFRGSLTASGGVLYAGSWYTGSPTSNGPIGVLGYPGANILSKGALSIVVMNMVTQQPDTIFYGVVPSTFDVTWANGQYTVQNLNALYKSVE
jgi:hypothetical protein